MASSASAERNESNLFLDMVEALANRHGEVDIRLEHLNLRLPLMRESLELNGAITVSVHLRELSDKEKAARIAKEVRSLQP
jgi:hypothetical protein